MTGVGHGVIVAAFIGAALALTAQWLFRRQQRAATGRTLSAAFLEELGAVEFMEHPATERGIAQDIEICGFSSQTFDTLFRDLADALPYSLARDLMRYHWRVKHWIHKRGNAGKHLDPDVGSYLEAKALRQNLVRRLAAYAQRPVLLLVFSRAEDLRGS